MAGDDRSSGNKRPRDNKNNKFQANNRKNSRRNNNNKRSKQQDDNKKRGPPGGGFDESRDDRDKPPHEGSFAFEGLRTQLDVSLEPRTVVGEDQKMLKRKVALLLGFIGTKYAGFQINPRQRTIQAEIELALYRAGMLTTLNFGRPTKYSWSSSARTDKGVHACAQVCSAKVELFESEVTPSQQQLKEMEKKNAAAAGGGDADAGTADSKATTVPTVDSGDGDLEAARKRLEEYLPPDIRVLDMLRTTRNMCAKTQRDRVRYQYMIPSFMLHENWKQILSEEGISLEEKPEDKEKISKHPLTDEQVQKMKSALEGYRSTEEQQNRLKAALDRYKGTNPFHNFTKGIQPGQPQANRFIEYFRVQDPVVIDGVEWIPTQVLGQSFLLHQIRKMISMAIDIARGAAPLEIMDKALNKKERVRVGIAPAQGLFLEMSFFGGYNRRKAKNADLPNLDWSQEGPAKERWEVFRNKIRQHIVEEEKQQSNFIQYMFLHEYYKFAQSYEEVLAGKSTEEGDGEEASADKETKEDDAVEQKTETAAEEASQVKKE